MQRHPIRHPTRHSADTDGTAAVTLSAGIPTPERVPESGLAVASKTRPATMIHDALPQHTQLETLGPPPSACADLADQEGDIDGLPRWTIPVPSLERPASGEWGRFFEGDDDGALADDTIPGPRARRETDAPRPTSSRLDTLPCPPPDQEVEPRPTRGDATT